MKVNKIALESYYIIKDVLPWAAWFVLEEIIHVRMHGPQAVASQLTKEGVNSADDNSTLMMQIY
jgi:hypothetical protein